MEIYIHKADIYCKDCGENMKTEMDVDTVDDGDSDIYPQGPFANSGGEADTPHHCGDCCKFLENDLTSDGVKYVREAIADDSGDQDVLRQWAEFYKDQLED